MSKRKAEALQQKSPAEFFAENKNIAGFDNVSSSKLHRLAGQMPFIVQYVYCFAAWQMFVHQHQRACGKLT